MRTLSLIGGWFSSDNIGDRAILFGLLDAWREHGVTKFNIIDEIPEEVAAEKGVHSYPPKKRPIALALHLMRSDALLYTGGTPFYEAPVHMTYFAGLALLARLARRPVMVLGVSIRSLRSMYCRALTRWILRHSVLVGAREYRTLDEFHTLTKGRNNVVLVPDAAVKMRPVDAERACELLIEEKLDLDRPHLAICVRDFRTNESFRRSHYSRGYTDIDLEAYHKAICDVAIHAVEHLAMDVVFFPMNTRMPDDDRRLALEIQRRIEAPQTRTRIHVVTRQYGPREMKAMLGRMRAVVAVRFHATLLATAMGVPTIGICYALKNKAILGALHQQRFAVDLLDLDHVDLCHMLGDLLADEQAVRVKLVEEYKQLEALFDQRILEASGML